MVQIQRAFKKHTNKIFKILIRRKVHLIAKSRSQNGEAPSFIKASLV